MSRVLVVSPHPDDESIGCGGTLRKHVCQGDAVRLIFLTSGEQGGHGRSPDETVRVREREAEEAAGILGLFKIEFWREPDGAVRASRRLAEKLRKAVREWEPRLVYVPHRAEMHPDHRASARLVRRALLDLALPARPTVRMFEVWTPMQQIDEVVDISEYMEAKLAAVRAYKSQCEVMRFDEAVLGLDRYRGEMHSGWPVARYAEIFSEVRLRERISVSTPGVRNGEQRK